VVVVVPAANPFLFFDARREEETNDDDDDDDYSETGVTDGEENARAFSVDLATASVFCVTPFLRMRRLFSTKVSPEKRSSSLCTRARLFLFARSSVARSRETRDEREREREKQREREKKKE